MEEKKVLVLAHYNVLLKANGLIVDNDEVEVELNKTQYDRLKASYDSGEFKLMNEDIDLLDVYKAFCKEADRTDNLALLMEYPEEIVEGWSFEDILRGYENPIPMEVLQQICDETLKEFEDEIQAIADEAYAEIEAEYEREQEEKKNKGGNCHG